MYKIPDMLEIVPDTFKTSRFTFKMDVASHLKYRVILQAMTLQANGRYCFTNLNTK